MEKILYHYIVFKTDESDILSDMMHYEGDVETFHKEVKANIEKVYETPDGIFPMLVEGETVEIPVQDIVEIAVLTNQGHQPEIVPEVEVVEE